MRHLTGLTASLFLASTLSAFAAGGDETPPKPTKTTSECTDAQIYDEKTKTCVDADKQSFNDQDRYRAVRELAYAGHYNRALQVIASADDPKAAQFLNYQGFIHRQSGKMDAAMAYYSAALREDPDYILARSYMGQGLVQMGHIAAAKAQLSEIAERGGRDTWAYVALANTIDGKAVATY